MSNTQFKFPIEDLVRDLYESVMNETTGNTDYDVVLKSIIDKHKSKLESLVNEQFTLTHLVETSPVYNSVIKLLIERYSKMFALFEILGNITRNFEEMPESILDNILSQFGYSSLKTLNYQQKKSILMNVSAIVTSKATYNTVLSLMSIITQTKSLRISNLDLIFASDGKCYLYSKNDNRKIPIDELANNDNNKWFLKTETVAGYVFRKTTAFPMRSQYFVSSDTYVKLQLVMEFFLLVNYLITKSMINYALYNNVARDIYVGLFDANLSLLEVYTMISTFYKQLYLFLTNNSQTPNVDFNKPVLFVNIDESNLGENIISKTFNLLVNTVFPDLKDIVYEYYLSKIQNGEIVNIEFEDFKTYIMLNWPRYYDFEAEYIDSILESIFNSLIKAYYASYVELIKNQFTVLGFPHTNAEMKETIDEFYQLFTVDLSNINIQTDNNGNVILFKSDDILYNLKTLILYPDKILETVNKPLYDFIIRVVNDLANQTIEPNDVRLLIYYLINAMLNFMQDTYGIDIPDTVFVSSAFLSHYNISHDLSELKLRDIIPIFVEQIFDTETVLIRNIPSLDSFLVDDSLILRLGTIWNYDSPVKYLNDDDDYKHIRMKFSELAQASNQFVLVDDIDVIQKLYSWLLTSVSNILNEYENTFIDENISNNAILSSNTSVVSSSVVGTSSVASTYAPGLIKNVIFRILYFILGYRYIDSSGVLQTTTTPTTTTYQSFTPSYSNYIALNSTVRVYSVNTITTLQTYIPLLPSTIGLVSFINNINLFRPNLIINQNEYLSFNDYYNQLENTSGYNFYENMRSQTDLLFIKQTYPTYSELGFF